MTARAPDPVPRPVLAPRAGAGVVTDAAPDLSVIVLSWNSARFLDGCLGSLRAQQGALVETIVIDNGSTDGSQELVREGYPDVRLVEMGENVGFCDANNVGLGYARAPFVLFLNSDIVLEATFVSEALRSFDRDPRIGLVGGKLLRFDRRTVDSAGQFLTRSRKVVERGYGAPDGPYANEEGYVFSICGAAMLWRGETIADVSVKGELFDRSYFAFSEDLDAGWRARLAGWRAWYAPRAIGYHYRGGTESGVEGTALAPAGTEAASRPSAASRDVAPHGHDVPFCQEALSDVGIVQDLPETADASGARGSDPRIERADRGPEVLQDRRGAKPVLPAILRRPRSLRYHILKNRWLTILKNDSARSVLRDLPFIALRDAALLGAAAAASPGVLLDLARSGPLVRRAIARRREFLSREGRWGPRRPGARAAWIRWSAPRSADPS